MRDILKRYIKITIFIVTALLIMNFFLIKVILDFTESSSPQERSYFLNGITIADNVCSISDESIKYVKNNYKWMMILDDSGKLIYSYMLPDELKRDYTVGEIADGAKWYLEDYPINMINAPGGLVILGKDSKSIWKKNVAIKLENGIVAAVVVVVLNIVVTIVLAYLLSFAYMKELKTVVAGILEVSDEKEIKLDEKGHLKEIIRAINNVSEKLTEQKKAIKKSNKMKEEWLAGVSHDIRTPLSVIVGNVEELYCTVNKDEKNCKLDIIKNQSFKIKYLVNDLNLINKMDNNFFELNTKVLDINRLLRECIVDVMNMYGQDKYEFIMKNESEDEKLYLECDEHLLKRAFGNILINSIVHNEQGCKVVIYVREKDSDINIIFEDNGGGVNREKICMLNTMKEGNTDNIHGWGTMVVKRIIQLHSGNTKFNNLNNGMQVEITLPQKLD